MTAKNGRAPGFTLLELILLLVVLAAIAAIAVPKWLALSRSVIEARCEANRAVITTAVYMKYASKLQADSTDYNWLETATMDSLQDSMFVDLKIPNCPTDGSYTLSRGVVKCSVHGE